MQFVLAETGRLSARDGGGGLDPLRAHAEAIARDAIRAAPDEAADGGTVFAAFVSGRDRPGAVRDGAPLAISAADLDRLRELATRDWVSRADGSLVPSEAIRIGPGPTLHMGSVPISLAASLPLASAGWPHRVSLLRDGWKVEEFLLCRPLVIVVAEGGPDGPEAEAAALASASLAGTGGLGGAVRTLAPAEVERCLGSADAAAFQPILLVAPDTMAEAPLAGVLPSLARLERAAAVPAAPDRRAGGAGPGLTLAQDAGLRTHGLGAGFDPAPFAVPHAGHRAAAAWRLGRRIASGLRAASPAEALPWADAEALNYAALAGEAWPETATLARATRAHDSPAGGGVCLVRFGGIADRAARLAAMRRHAASRREAETTPVS